MYRENAKTIRCQRIALLDPREHAVSGDDASIPPVVTDETDTDLQAVIDAWPDLSEAVKAGIIAMVKVAFDG
ncbi:MAG: hypothetical protein ISR77_15860 [Pirellulaceae bacterium]|nr:hypothetical protein [Pirellulaceae bacterium]